VVLVGLPGLLPLTVLEPPALVVVAGGGSLACAEWASACAEWATAELTEEGVAKNAPPLCECPELWTKNPF